MAASHSNARRAAVGYMERTHRPLNCLMFLLPMLAAYEAGALFFDQKLLAIKHLGELLALFGASGRLLPPVLVIVVMLAWHVISRERWHVDGETLLGMLVESALAMVPLVLLAMLFNRVFATPMTADGADRAAGAARLLTGVGAGIYEEFLFRLAGISLVLFVFVDVMALPKKHIVIVGVVLTSVAFSLYHFVGADTFTWPTFVFRAVAGAYLAGLYIARGFGVAVGAHAAYNVITTLINS